MEHSGNKYHRKIHDISGKELDGVIDVYSVLEAFDVKSPAIQHAIKKLLCAGIRGKGDERQDLSEAIDAIDRKLCRSVAKDPDQRITVDTMERIHELEAEKKRLLDLIGKAYNAGWVNGNKHQYDPVFCKACFHNFLRANGLEAQ